DLVRRDAQWRDAQLVLHKGVCTAHSQFSAPASIPGQADIADMMGSHEINEGVRPAEWAVNPGFVGLLNLIEDDVVVSRAGNDTDDRASARPFDARQRGSRRHYGKIYPGSYHR